MPELIKKIRNDARQAMEDAQVRGNRAAYLEAKAVFEKAVDDYFNATRDVNAQARQVVFMEIEQGNK